MYQAGIAQAGQRSQMLPANTPEHDISSTYPGVWKLFRAMAPSGWQDSYVRDVFSDVVVRYTETHRKYHNLSHLEDLASQFEFNQQFLTAPQAKAVRAALVLHDIVYDCMTGADETASSEYAGNFLRNKLMAGKKMINVSRKIILATASHKSDGNDFATRLFLDMDMSVLASRPDQYARYLAGVTAEYCTKLQITPEQFAKARAERFLKPTLESSTPIFTTDQYRELEPLARSNLRHE